MPVGDYLAGVGVFAGMLAGVLAAAWLVLDRRYPQLAGATRVVAYGVLCSVGIFVVHVVPGMFGALGRGSVVAASVLLVGLATLVPRVTAAPAPAPGPARSDTPAESALAALTVLVVGVFAVAVARAQVVASFEGNDALGFHLPTVARWVQTGSIWDVSRLIPGWSFGYYPNTGDLMVLATVLPWHADFLARFAMWPFWALSGVATYAIARELRSARSASAACAALVLSIPIVAGSALSHLLIDAVMLFGFAAGVLFLVRHARNRSRSELVLAGLALGISFGTKWYGVSAVAIVVVVWAAGHLLASRDARRVGAELAALVGVICASGGIWLLRNLVDSGNPFFPVKLAPLGATIFDAPHDEIRAVYGGTVADHLGDLDIWADEFLPQYRDVLAAPSLVLAGLAAAAVVAVVVRAHRGERRFEGFALPLAFGTVAVMIALAYSITPYTAPGEVGSPLQVAVGSRYLVPALILCAALAAGAWTRWPRLGTAFGIVALLAALDGVVQVVDGRLFRVTPSLGHWLLAAALGAVAAAAWLAGPRRLAAARAFAERRRVLTGIAGALAVAAVVAGGYRSQERFGELRYRGDAAIDWLIVNVEAGHRVGITGTRALAARGATFPAYGPRLENTVGYVGPVREHVRRQYRDRDGFVAALRRDRYDVLLVARGPGLRAVVPEERWARSAGYRLVARSPHWSAFEASPRLLGRL